MPPDDASLRALRAVFRDELDDARAPLERAVAALRDGAPANPELAAEVFRVVHSLKGAARAVAWPTIESVCHDAETRLADARAGRVSDEVLRRVTVAIERAVRACVLHLDAHGTPDDDALREARAAFDAAPARTGRTAPHAIASASAASTTNPASPANPTPSAPSKAPATMDREGTQRVSVERLHGLERAAEELAAASHVHPGAELDALDGALDELRASLALHGGLDARARAAMRAVLQRTTELRAAHTRARASVQAASETALHHVRRMRVQRVESLVPALERAAHDAASALGRSVRVEVDGAEVEVDRRVLEGLREPLLHAVRNAVDHGIEAPDERRRAGKDPVGRLRLAASSAGGQVTLTCADDGRGVDVRAVLDEARRRGMKHPPTDPLALLFEPGFSTRGEVSAFSGRGVGLDVVRQRVAQLQGHVALTSAPTQGTRLTVTVPVDLSATRALLARVGDVTVAFVSTAVRRVRRVGADEVVSAGGGRHVLDDGALVPLTTLAATLGFAAAPPTLDAKRPCVVVAAGERRAAFTVDALVDEADVVVRSLGPRLARVPFVSGTARRDDGELVLVLHAGDLVGYATPGDDEVRDDARAPKRVLVVDDSLTTRQLLRTILEASGYVVTVAGDGEAAWALLSGTARFDAVVTDIEMPRVDGWTLLARIRGHERTARTPVVVVTALSQVTEQQRAVSLGASAYLAKGRFDQDALVHALGQLVDDRGAR